MQQHWRRGFAAVAFAFAMQGCSSEPSAPPLPTLNLDLREITVSGISSGGFMAVQFGVAHSEAVKGVAVTAGGPYFCAGDAGVSTAIARCMQGDPMFPAQPITDADLDRMTSSTRAWAEQGRIDSISALTRQQVWIFHGTNDGTVKRPVTDALAAYYRTFVPEHQIFYKRDLPAGHAQISAVCTVGERDVCTPCANTGGRFINACAEDAEHPERLYDPFASALQQFYGRLAPPTSAPSESLHRFDQRPYVLEKDKPLSPKKISLADTGYLFLPQACRDGAPCRLHIAFHGCQQYAGKIGLDFVQASRLNDWAESNRLVVLYPQTTASTFAPANPGGCWDWWGYNDASGDMTGRYATKDGAQIAAIWRMVEALAGKGEQWTDSASDAKPELVMLDRSFDQALLAWRPIPFAQSYSVFRRPSDTLPPDSSRRASTLIFLAQLTHGQGFTGLTFADHGLDAQTEYIYHVCVKNTCTEAITLRTAAQPPACDPYFSMFQGKPVDRNNQPTNVVCP